MENYIVRIYRRETDDPGGVVGTVECVETRLNRPFHGLNRLRDLLATEGMGATGDTVTAGDEAALQR